MPEAQVGGPIALVQDGDVISIDAVANTLNVDVSDEEMARRKAAWTPRPPPVSSGALFKYQKLVTDASRGCGKSSPRTCTLARANTSSDGCLEQSAVLMLVVVLRGSRICIRRRGIKSNCAAGPVFCHSISLLACRY